MSDELFRRSWRPAGSGCQNHGAPLTAAATESAKEPSGPAAAVAPFARFLESKDAAEIVAAHAEVIAALSLPKAKVSLAQLGELLKPSLPHRCRQLLGALEARAAHPQYTKQRQRGTRSVMAVAVVGAGPAGLRIAIELALAGSRVDVFEGRDGFSRLQVLHLWEWVEVDLAEIGVKIIDPSIFAATDKRRCTTSQLQHSLLKVALLLGVRVHFSCRVDTVARLTEVLGGSGMGGSGLDCLIDASGARCALLDSLGFSQVVAFRSARALCIVISLVNGKTSDELGARESSWAQQFYQAEFAALRGAGVDLENLVYYRSSGAFCASPTHYFVMTTDGAALHAFGALRELQVASAAELCAPPNVDADQLEAYARLAIKAFVPPLAGLPLAAGQLSLFDFSERKQSNVAATVLPPGDASFGRPDSCCLVTRVGDALQEPFWPEGLGINRGFLGILDCADLVQGAASLLLRPLGQPHAAVGEFEALLRRREELFALAKRLSGTNRQTELKPHLDAGRRYCYAIDPRTRYMSWRGSPVVAPPSADRGGKVSASGPRMAFHVDVVRT